MMAAADDIEVSPLRADDAAAATAVLVAAFARDPVLADFLLRRGPLAAAAHDAFFRFNLLRGYLARPKSLALSSVLRARGGGVVGVALWAPPGPPGSSGLPLGEMLRMLTIARTAFGLLGIGRALRAGLRVDAAHPAAPHYFLGFLAVRPTHQGRGLGARLLAPVLAWASRSGSPVTCCGRFHPSLRVRDSAQTPSRRSARCFVHSSTDTYPAGPTAPWPGCKGAACVTSNPPLFTGSHHSLLKFPVYTSNRLCQRALLAHHHVRVRRL